MEYEKNTKIQSFRRNLTRVFKWIFCTIYFSSTATVPIYVFTFVFSLKNSVIYAVVISFVFLIGMDIICSIIEDILVKIYKFIANIHQKKKMKKEKIKKEKQIEIKQLEKLILEKNDYKKEIEEIQKDYSIFSEKILQVKNNLPGSITEGLIDICNQIENMIELLNEDAEEYYQIRHTFRIYFPEFKKMTYKFIDIARLDNLDNEIVIEFMRLITEFREHLSSIKRSINEKDKLSLNVGIESLVKIMETERKKRW